MIDEYSPSVAAVAGGRSEHLTSTVRAVELDVVLLPAQFFAQCFVGFMQLHKLAVQRRICRVAVRVQLQHEQSQR